jgi:DNA-binding transcriptional ArsR family regulator
MDVLQVVAEPRRREILHLVWERELPVSDIAREVRVTIGSVSQHLAVLHEAGIVELRKEGKYRYYRANQAVLGPLREVLEQMWAGKLDRLARLAEAAEPEGEEQAPWP